MSTSTLDEHALKNSEARLFRLIEARTHPDADVAEIDRRIWDLFGEEWAIMWTDLSGFSRQAADFGIIHFLQVIHEQKQLLLPIVDRHDGVLIKVEADSFLLIFKRPEQAVRAAIEMQSACQKFSERRLANEQIILCVGVGFGRILKIGDQDVWGEQVNAASKLGEDTARGHEVLVTDAVVRALTPDSKFDFAPHPAVVAGSPNNHALIYRAT